MREAIAYLGLGSNEGDRAAHLGRAVERLGAVPGIGAVRASSWHENAYVGDGPPLAPFLNGAVELRTVLSPAALLGVAKALEAEAGRRLPAPHHRPRPLDIDLLLHGDTIVDTRDLVVPHPRWHEREFVRRPLRELGLDLDALPRWQRPAVLHTPAEFAARCSTWLGGGCTVGLVPTMGALHDGHASLMRRARAECDRTAVTIFVNPLQFGPGEDFAAYPRTFDADLRLCAAQQVDVVFAPEPAAMYDPDFCSHVAVGAAATTMEGALRPGHFGGVATVVARLLALARPTHAYFGEKDAQQLAVVRRMVQDLGFPTAIVPCPIVREPDGLARSSRNVYLGAEDRRACTILYRALASARHAFARGERDRDALLARARAVLATEPRAALDYLELRRDGDLAALPPGPVDGGRLLVAARFAGGVRPVRLLDNLSLDAPPDLPAAAEAP
ncbi:MAG: pantoate--beta-alanine ligase [Planctomycetes bacterium]|nr:pantoate--beta-alanine ligase [Planctomycetota bacterium]